MADWVVQKFGGTSVGKFPLKIVNDIVKTYNEESRVAVVCSARSSDTKSEGTTSRLLLCANQALSDQDYRPTLKLIKDDHVQNAEKFIKNDKIRQQLIADIVELLNQVEAFLHASTIIEEVSNKTLDSIVSVGERLSCSFIAALMNDNNVPAKFIDLSYVIPYTRTASLPSNADVNLDQQFYSHLSHNLKKLIDSELQGLASNTIPVLTGYFGVVPGGLLNNIGRGYTDLCAALVAVGLHAHELQIWKEVDGIFSADPRKVKNAKLIPVVTPDEAAELTYYGSEVIHPFTMEQVINAKIPIRIKNVENPKGNGTVIYPDSVSAQNSKLDLPSFNVDKKPTAVTAKHDIVVLNVHSNKKTLSHGFLASIFAILDRYKLVVDLISTSEVHVSMALYSTEDHLNSDLKKAMLELKKMGEVDIVKNLAIVSVVGKQMRHLIGIAGQMFSTLAKAGVNIEMISQGANEINISCVVSESDSLKALQSIHEFLIANGS